MSTRNGGCFLQSRQRYQRNDDYEEVNDLFNKKYQFRFENEWNLPSLESWFSVPPWKDKDLDTLKTRLNFYKSQLNDFNIEEWSSHTRRRNPAGEVGWKIRSTINPEFLTQAWTKFYECACSYNIIPAETIIDKKIVSLHLCEAPGAFITSLNHFLKSNHPDIEWKWLANTLNPYYEGNSPSNMISDDRFMFYTLDNWHFGIDNTGNLMDWENSQAIVNKAKSLGKVLLVTADGSIDCLQKPDAQEEVTSPLHYCEIITALQALSPGGTFLFKLFTIFEHSTVSLLYLINHLFEDVNIYKPVTSRQGNSEVYAICLKYKGSQLLEKYLPSLKAAYGTELYENLSLFPLETIPQSFLKQVLDCAYYFSSIQCQVINSNLQAYLMQNNPVYNRDVRRIRAMVASEFLYQYNLRPVDYKDEILKGILHEENKINTNPRYHRGSYTERELYTTMDLKEKNKYLKAFLEAEILSNPMMVHDAHTKWTTQDENIETNLVFTYGHPLQRINSSKFIFVPIFKLYLQILAEEEYRDIIFNIKSIQNPAIISCDSARANTETKELIFPDYNYEEPYHIYEKKCFKNLVETLNDLTEGSDLSLRNYTALTHFNVGVLYMVSKSFEKTGFTSNGCIILNKLRIKDQFKYLNMTLIECKKVEQEGIRDVLNILPVQVINAGDFFNSIVIYNNTFYRNKCIEYLESIQMSL